MAEQRSSRQAYRPPTTSSYSSHLSAQRPLALPENEPIDQFIQTGGGDYYPSSYVPGGGPSEHDYFSLFAEFAMDLTPPASSKSSALNGQHNPVLGKTGLAPTHSTTVVPPEALATNTSAKRKKDTAGYAKVVNPKPSGPSAKKAKEEVPPAEEASDNESPGLDSDSLPERERRLLKNRKAAQQFRKRQKSHIIELEARVDTLSTENSGLTSQVGLLQAENRLIREQLDYMRSFVLNALQFSFPPNVSLQDIQKTIMPLALSRDDKDGSAAPSANGAVPGADQSQS